MLEAIKGAWSKFATLYTEWSMSREIAWTLADYRIAQEQRQLLEARLNELNSNSRN